MQHPSSPQPPGYQKEIQYREPPPYPGTPATKSFLQPGYRQSYSGSEASTDVSLSSNENLCTSMRQDPQGEENTHTMMAGPMNYSDCLHQALMDPESLGIDSSYSILARLGMPLPAVEPKNTVAGPVFITSTSPSNVTHPHQAVHQYVNMMPSTSMRTHTVPHPSLDIQASYTTPSVSISKVPVMDYQMQAHSQPMPPTVRVDDQCQASGLSGNTMTLASTHLQLPVVPVTAQIVRSQTAPVVLQHSQPAQNLISSTQSATLPQTPDAVQHKQKKELRRSYEMLDHVRLTRSQPDLTKLMDSQKAAGQANTSQSQQTHPHASHRVRHQQSDIDNAAIAAQATQMMEMLSEENKMLRAELEGYYKKVSKLQKFELEIQRLHESHQALIQHSQKRESLEKAMRARLESTIRKQRLEFREVKDQLEKARALSQPNEMYNHSDSEMKKELSRKDTTIAKLLNQNKDTSGLRERLEVEVATQRSTIIEQRKHIEVLDSALMNAQSTIIKLEQQLRHKVGEEEKVEELQKALVTLQATKEKREALEHRLRGKLEEEIKALKDLQVGRGKLSDTDEGIASDTESPTSIQSLVNQLQEKEQRILEMEAEVIRWEQRHLEETAIRQLAIDVASTPKDARIAALEQSSAETEKLIADARTERYKHMDEVYQANRKCAELEAKAKMMQAQLAEKDALIRVLQKHSSLSRTSSVTSLLSSPIHSPHPSLASTSPSPLPLSAHASHSSSPHTPRQSLSQTPSPLTPRASVTLPQRPLSATSRPLTPLVAKIGTKKSATLDSSVFKEGKGLIQHVKSNSTGTPASLLDAMMFSASPLSQDDTGTGGDSVSKVLWQV